MLYPGYSGAFNPLAAHTALSDFIGSVTIVSLSTCSHLVHSNVRRSWPDGPGEVRARFMRVWHFGQRGRSIADKNGPDVWE
jgi:hypothetical protein